MASIKLDIPGYQEFEGEAPIVILGPNGSGKTKLAQRIAANNKVTVIGAQRRTWVDDNLPVQEEQNLLNNIRSSQDHWRQHSWQPTEEISFVLSRLIQEHVNQLTQKNEEARASGTLMVPVTDTNLMRLQAMWSRLFPKRKLEIGGYFPRVRRLDGDGAGQVYFLREMSDGERTVLYMASRVLTADQPVMLVDEPELHMHSRLSIQFWDEAEKLRPDCRFVYVTHDLSFALSRRKSTILRVQSNGTVDALLTEELSDFVAKEILGAATLPFYAKRIFFYEGEPGKGTASEFFSVWFNDEETFAIPAGNCNSVISAVTGLNKVGVLSAEVLGLIDRDFYSDDVLNKVGRGVMVVPVHEIESIFCDKEVVSCIAECHLKDPETIWQEFHSIIKQEFQGKTLNNIVAQRVRARVGDLLDGVFDGRQVERWLEQTADNHAARFSEIDIPTKIRSMFCEEEERVTSAINGGGPEMLAILPGKHLLSLIPRTLGLRDSGELTGLVFRALDHRLPNHDGTAHELGDKLEKAMLKYLPPRRSSN